MQSLIKQITKSLNTSPSSIDAHRAMAPKNRVVATTTPADARQAGVMALFFPKGHEWHLALIQRKQNKNDRHSGQISLPGGSHDLTDTTLLMTALRETEEEIGVPREKIQLLGELSELYIPVSHFNVKPYVGYVESEPLFVPEEAEVESILEVSFSHLTEAQNRGVVDMQMPNGLVLKDVPHFNFNNHIVWGATAMILNELIIKVSK